MKNYVLNAEALVMMSGSSAGTQPKYYDKGFWYKTNNNGYEGLSEYLVSKFLSCTNLKNYVEYEQCTVNGRNGCRSRNFLEKYESFISFQRLYDMFHGGNLIDSIMIYDDVSKRIDFVKDFILDSINLDVSEYLSSILTLDLITLNTDRHFHNLGVVADIDKNEFKPAPIFDNGNSLLSDFEKFPKELSIEENIDSVYGQPFSSSLSAQAFAAGLGIKINKSALNQVLENEPDSRALQVLKYQLDSIPKELFIS